MKRIISFLACALLVLSSSLAFASPKTDEWQRQANAGDPLAMVFLGSCYLDGDEGFPKDYHKSNEYWLKATNHPKWNTIPVAVRGEVYYNLGNNYDQGRGFRQDYFKAVEYWRKAADLGNANAMFNLGVSYSKGQGVRQDQHKAKEYFGMACDHGDQGGCDSYRKRNELGIY